MKPTNPQKQMRIRHTEKEKAMILGKAIEMRAEDPSITLRQLWIGACSRALPPDRRPNFSTGIPKSRYGWLEEAMRTLEAESVETPTPEPNPATPEPAEERTPAPSPREIAHTLVERLFEPDTTRDDLLVRRIRELSLALEQSEERSLFVREDLTERMERLAERVDKLTDCILQMHKAFGELVGDPQVTPAKETPREQPQVHHDDKPPPQRPRRVKVGLVGPLPDQVEAVRRHMKRDAKIVSVSNEPGGNLIREKLGHCDYIVVSYHAKHRHLDAARDTVGRDRTVQMRTGGVVEIARKIDELIGAQAGGGAP
jgi:hypothetical protein